MSKSGAGGGFILDRTSLLLLGILAFLLALWLLYRILKNRPLTRNNTGAEAVEDATVLNKLPPPPHPKIEKVLMHLEGDYPEFCNIVREVQRYTPMQTLLSQAELRKGFAHLETLLLRVDQVPDQESKENQATGKPLLGDIKQEIKATMLTIIRLIQDIQGVRIKSGNFID